MSMSQESEMLAQRPRRSIHLELERRRSRPGNPRSDERPQEKARTSLDVQVPRDVVAANPAGDSAVPQHQQQGSSNGTATRGFAPVNLALRPSSAFVPLPPIDVASESTSPSPSPSPSPSLLDPWSFQSQLDVDVGHEKAPCIGPARITAYPEADKPSNPGTDSASTPAAPVLRMSGPTATMASPSLLAIATPSSSSRGVYLPGPCCVSPDPPGAETAVPECEERPEYDDGDSVLTDESREILKQVPEEFKALVTDQLVRKDRLARALEAERARLEELREEVRSYTRMAEQRFPAEEIERYLRGEVPEGDEDYVRPGDNGADDPRADHEVPLEDPYEDFYEELYTGQQYIPRAGDPPEESSSPSSAGILREELPSRSVTDETTGEDSDGPPGLRHASTFNNPPPQLSKFERFDMPTVIEVPRGTGLGNTNQQQAAYE